MSVVVYDGKSVVADKQGTNINVRSLSSKLTRIQQSEIVDDHVVQVPYILGWVGTQSSGLLMQQWWLAGANPDTFPICQHDNERWSRLIVVNCLTKNIFMYEQLPVAIPVEDSYMAWGSGSDFALGALAMGATARRAAEIACQFCIYCGYGVQEYIIDEPDVG